MSQVKLTADSGGGTVAIKGPASTTGNNPFELTVPGTASGTILTSNSSVGKLVKYQNIIWTTYASINSTSTRPEVSSSLRFTYTPTSATNKIIIRYTLRASNANAAVSMFFLGKDVSNYSDMANSEYVNSPAAFSSGGTNDDGNSVMYGSGDSNGLMQQITLMGIETAGNTNQRIYSVHCKNTSGGVTHFNRWVTAAYYGTSFGELFEVEP